jgi:hypothetical protein
MTVYYLVFLATVFLGLIVKPYKHHNTIQASSRRKRVYLTLSFLIITLVVGLRASSVGIDTPNYIRSFVAINQNKQVTISAEVVSDIVRWLCSRVSNKPTFYLLFLSTLTSYLFAKFIYEKSEDVVLSLIVYLGFFFAQSMNLMDQWLAMGFGINALAQFQKGKTRKAILLAVSAALTHTTAIVMFVFPLFARFRNKKRAMWLFIIGSAIFITFNDILLRLIVQALPQYSQYVYGRRYGVGGVSTAKIIIYIMILLVILFLIYLKPSNLNDEEKNEMYEYASFLSLAIAFSIAGARYTYMNRVAYYFSITLIVSLPGIINRISIKKIASVILMFAMGYMLYRNSINDLSGISNYIWVWK